uniref:Uncharacterized protein n=1 Tax=Naja naja TaxID=35670 RepID=A0A8C6XDI6_NAJNA
MLIFFYTNELVTCLESSEKVQVMATLFFDSKSMIVCLTGAKGRWGLVDHAGEYGANRIYAGQMAVLGRSSVGPVIRQMWEQEKDHLKKMKELVVLYRVRPTILLPLWDVAGYMLGEHRCFSFPNIYIYLYLGYVSSQAQL